MKDDVNALIICIRLNFNCEDERIEEAVAMVKKLEEQARIGRAVMRANEKQYDLYYDYETGNYLVDNVDELLDWAEFGEGK